MCMEQFSQLTTLSMVSTTRVKSFEFWVLRFRDLGVFVFEFWVLRFRDLGVFVFEFWVLRFRFRVLRFRDLGSSFSSFGCFVFEIWVLRASVFVFECFVFETTNSCANSCASITLVSRLKGLQAKFHR